MYDYLKHTILHYYLLNEHTKFNKHTTFNEHSKTNKLNFDCNQSIKFCVNNVSKSTINHHVFFEYIKTNEGVFFKLIAQYIGLLIKWNNAYNLIANSDLDTIIKEHIIDSFTIAEEIYLHKHNIIIKEQYANINKNTAIINGVIDDKNSHKYKLNICDMGSGAGIPAIIIAILHPDCFVVTIDSVKKKFNFLNQVKLELNLMNLFNQCSRIQELSLDHLTTLITQANKNYIDHNKLKINHYPHTTGFINASEVDKKDKKIDASNTFIDKYKNNTESIRNNHIVFDLITSRAFKSFDDCIMLSEKLLFDNTAPQSMLDIASLGKKCWIIMKTITALYNQESKYANTKYDLECIKPKIYCNLNINKILIKATYI